MQERRMMSVSVMVEERVEDGGLRERSLCRRAWVFIETHCACSGCGGSGVCLWWWAVWMSGIRSLRIAMSSPGNPGLLLVVRLAYPAAIGEAEEGFIVSEPEGDADRGE